MDITTSDPPAPLIPRRKVRTTDHLTPATAVKVPSEKWQAFGQAVLAFHHRVALTAMCRCGRTVIECDVLAQARQHGLLPRLDE